jgi:hypothetical protein
VKRNVTVPDGSSGRTHQLSLVEGCTTNAADSVRIGIRCPDTLGCQPRFLPILKRSSPRPTCGAGIGADLWLGGGAGARTARRVLAVVAMLLGAISDALLRLQLAPVAPLVLAAVLLASPAAATRQRSTPPETVGCQAMNGMSSGAIVTKGRIMSRSSCSRMWQWYMYRPL